MTETSLRMLWLGSQAPPALPHSVALYHEPMLVVEPIPLAGSTGWEGTEVALIFTSQNAVLAADSSGVFEELKSRVRQCWTVGEKTASLLRGRLPDAQLHVAAGAGDAASLAEAIATEGVPGTAYLSFELEGSSRSMTTLLPAHVKVLSIPAYRTIARRVPGLRESLERLRPDWILVGSPRGADALLLNLDIAPTDTGDEGWRPFDARYAVLGATTASHLTALGWAVDWVSSTPDLGTLVSELGAKGPLPLR